ncbi:MAG TPA: PRC-barrel domain-containing protein [Phycisphaerae bacterium]|nr:PRC-barrel domain-containing protein [Phycisphaerae bacterium]
MSNKLRKTIWTAVIVACGSWPVAGFADDKSQSKSPGELKAIADRSSKSLPDLMAAAESKTGGKTINAMLMEWRCVQDKVLSGPVTGDVSHEDLKNADPSSPVGHIITASDNKISEVIVCAKSGKVLCVKDANSFTPGKSAFHDGSGQKGRHARFARWNQAPDRTQRITDLLKKPVHNAQTDEHIGEVKDFVVDPDGGRLMFSVVEFYDKLGHGNRWYALPLSIANLSPDYKTFDMEYEARQVNHAQGFDRNTWPNVIEDKYATGIYESYGVRPYWKRGRRTEGSVRTVTEREGRTGANQRGRQLPQRWQKASDLVGKNVINPQDNESLGTLHDIVVDPDTGRIIYGVLSFGGFLGMGDKLFAIPWSSLNLASDYKAVHLTVDKDRLKTAEGFDKANWPNMADERFATKTHDFYGSPRYWENKDDMDDDMDDAVDEAQDKADDANDRND